jgi:anti-sigma B factor antagonist
MPCEVRLRQVGEIAVVDLNGRLTLGPGPDALRQTVFQLLEAGSFRILLNCGGLDFMDSAGLGEVVDCSTIVSRRGGSLRMCCVPPRVRDLLRMTRLTDKLPSHADEKSALEALAAHPVVENPGA